ncbi:centromere protein T isoform X2 [Gouania willdenowi]|uniref:centromere protein T isoform X2 n=1 Tax=Gouania willdenowi TaxID=441366 RepID=UPI00105472FB|nr:centromere protein T isoform X2 [Gouania willdenowi]
MDNTEDLSARFILGQILSTEIPRTPMIPSGSTQAPSSSGTRRSSRISGRDAGAQTPTDIVRHSMRRRISQSITQKSQPAPRRTAPFVRRKPRSSASMLFDDEQSPRILLKNILMTENVKSPLVHEKTPSGEPEPPLASSSTTNTHHSIELSDLDLSDLTVGNVISTAKGLNRKRPRRSLNVTAFEKRLRGADEAEERSNEASSDISSLSLSSSTSLSLKTPFVDVGTERKGLQRKVSQRRKITEEEFGAAVDKQQITGGTRFLPGKQDLSDTTHCEGFTLGLSKLSEPDVTTDILHCNTALYPQPDAITSDLSVMATQDKLTVAASQIQKDLEEREESMRESEEELNKVQSQAEEEGDVPDDVSQRENEAVSRSEEEVIVSGINAEEEEGTADSEAQENIEAEVVVFDFQEEVVESESQEEVVVFESQEEVVVFESQEEVFESDSQEEVVESESQQEVVESESQQEVVESESQEEVVESESQEEVVESESQEEVVESESQEEVVESESQEEVVESESQEEVVESESQAEVVESESQEEVVESESQEEVVESESQAEVVESESQEEVVESESQEEVVESESQEEAVAASDSDEDEDASQTSNKESSSFHPEPDHRADPESVADGEEHVDKAEHPSEDYPTDFKPRATMDSSSQFEEDGITSGSNKDDGKTERQRSERLDSNLELISRRSCQSEGALVVPIVQEEDLDKAREGLSEVKSKDLGSNLEMEGDENMVEPSNPEQSDASDTEDEEYPTEFSPEEEEDEEDISSKTPAFVRAKRNFFIPDPSDSPTVFKDNQASGTTQAVPAAKPKRARQVKKRSTARKALPKSYLMTVFRHFAKTKVASDVYPVLDEIMDKFFDRLADDLETYAAHAKRTTIDVEDVVLLLKRQGYVNDKVPVEVLIEKYLRMDQRRLLIPIATSGNVVIPKIRK